MEFVSDSLRKTARLGVAPALAATSYASGYLSKNVPDTEMCGVYSAKAGYTPEPSVRILPAHYFEPGVVAFTKPEEGEIAIPSLERAPYENGVQSWRIVLEHERMHNYIHRAGGIQDERGINNFVAYWLCPKYGIDRFPFPSY